MVKQQLMGIVFVLVGVGIVAFAAIGPFATYQEVQTHQTTEAEILSSGMESATETDDDGTEVEYYPRIEYEYTVDEETYTDVQVYHPSQVDNEPGELRGKEFDAKGDAQAVVDRFDDGRTVTVRYDTADPDYSYLVDPSRDLLISSGMMGVFGVVFGGLGIGGVLGLVDFEDE